MAISALAACAYAPEKEIQAKPAHIEAAVEPGQQVVIETMSGETKEFEVSTVGNGMLEGINGEQVDYSDIDRISIRTWKEPTHPCGAGRPVGCSIPKVVTAISGYYEGYKERFHPACVQHDFCYRHGAATYGRIRQDCDDQFLRDMNQVCGDSGGILGLLDADSYRERAECRFAADQLYLAVQEYGEDAFLTTTSSYCEYVPDSR
jgi:hypothetical protein